MKPSTKEVWLWLLLVMNPFNRKTTELLEHFDSAEELACAIRDGKCPGLSDAEKQRARTTRSREVRQIMQECAQNGIRIITLDDPEYPELLRNIYSPPIVLFVRGSLACLENAVSIAVVGPRQPSEYARRAARMLCGNLARLGTVLVSGLAVGIDAVAHSCAVEHGVPTIGVLACGQLVNYPAENEELKRRIVEGGGAVISELLPHAGVEGRYFHQRNRMISGLGLGTLVVEASTRSGCLITANHAVEQGRDLFCVPPSDITRESCAGVVPFLREGAIPVFDYLDIAKEYMYHFLNQLRDEPGLKNSRASVQPAERKQRPEPKRVISREKPVVPVKTAVQAEPAETPAPAATAEPVAAEERKAAPAPEVYAELNEIQAKLLKIVAAAPCTADELVDKTGLPYSQTAEALTELEILGHITLEPDGRYALG